MLSHADAFTKDAMGSSAEWLELGFIGVEVFFVLSGYLIGKILYKVFDKEATDYKEIFNFWKRRWFRTLPNYYLFCIIILALGLFFRYEKFADNPFVVLQHFLFWQNIWYPREPWFMTVSWSLAVEEWFYLIFPLIAVVVQKTLKTSAALTLLFSAFFLILVSFLFRQFPFLEIESLGDISRVVVYRLDSIAIGVIGVVLQKHSRFFIKFSCQKLLIR